MTVDAVVLVRSEKMIRVLIAKRREILIDNLEY